jgi:tetratricopeptide (TPR) repeat protein
MIMKRPTKQADAKPAAKAPAVLDANGQKDLFAAATKKFSKGDYAEAKSLFDRVCNGPSLAVCESARMYARMCEQRMDLAKPDLKTAEDHYNYGVAMINGRRFSDALLHLQKALQLSDAAHVRYALALASGLEGDMPGAVAHLQRAVEMDPSLRSFARSDTDFLPLLRDPVIGQILSPER